jgi:vacuolar-type H+-ATPase subunit H
MGAGAGALFAYNKKNENGGKNKADDLVRKAKNEASDIVLKAKTDAAEITSQSQQEEAERRREWKKTETRLTEREATSSTSSNRRLNVSRNKKKNLMI